jgi:hypothetical protein
MHLTATNITSRRRAWWRSVCALTLVIGTGACSSSPTGPSGTSLHVTAISPSRGSTTGDTSVTITGDGFASGATVTIGGVTATAVSIQSGTTLTAVVGARTQGGTADVVVSGSGTSATLTGGFTFVAPTGSNSPPVIATIRSTGSRANQPSGFGDVNETLTLVAETSPASLAYQWTGAGTFGAAAATTTWQLPATATPLPASTTATLKVTETFSEGGVTHRNISTSTFVVSLHDSQTEILDLGVDFLTLWSNSSNSTNTVLHNFSTTCDNGRGRNNEASDTDNAHAQFVQDFPKFTIARRPPVTFNFAGRCVLPDGRVQPNVDACSAYTVHWEINQIPGGQRVITDGIDYVSAVLENNQWRLCHSDFIGSSRNGFAASRTTSIPAPRTITPGF